MAITEEARAKRNAYKREWAKKNKEKIQEYQERYWTKKAEQAAAEADPTEGRAEA